MKKYGPQKAAASKSDIAKKMPALGDLAIKLFGSSAGIELDLPQYPPHEPLEF
ncbi:hypothetical protein QUF76_13625 [Desulfobacterales bacterium HSG16]|nr:hypothetical protein [Desulfobacterales bacterium HSG16]